MRVGVHLVLLVGLAVGLASGEQVRKAAKKARMFEQDCLSAHNKLRKLHGTPALKIDRKVSLLTCA